MKYLMLVIVLFLLWGCATSSTTESNKWNCVEYEGVLFSINQLGQVDSVQKACSCKDIADFQNKTFGAVDKNKLSQLGCN